MATSSKVLGGLMCPLYAEKKAKKAQKGLIFVKNPLGGWIQGNVNTQIYRCATINTIQQFTAALPVADFAKMAFL